MTSSNLIKTKLKNLWIISVFICLVEKRMKTVLEKHHFYYLIQYAVITWCNSKNIIHYFFPLSVLQRSANWLYYSMASLENGKFLHHFKMWLKVRKEVLPPQHPFLMTSPKTLFTKNGTSRKIPSFSSWNWRNWCKNLRRAWNELWGLNNSNKSQLPAITPLHLFNRGQRELSLSWRISFIMLSWTIRNRWREIIGISEITLSMLLFFQSLAPDCRAIKCSNAF